MNPSLNTTPPPNLLPLLQRLKEGYKSWYSYLFTLPKIHGHSLGQKIDSLFVDAIETVAAASFSSGTEKIPYIRHAIKKNGYPQTLPNDFVGDQIIGQ
ncbi:MAG: hypothetical protein KC736_00015 [Candidatus Moranbacteria bacterium]|nr:hypothetical protein [Candidatus Moranbacteria bacterium]